MDKKCLLPKNTTPLLRAIALANADLEEIQIPIRSLINPELCPMEFLPFLAWALTVDRWDDNWSEKTKRQVVKDSYYTHKTKGTRASLERIAAAMGYDFSIEEWYESETPAERGSFIIHLSLGSTGITQATIEEFTRLVDDARPESRRATLQMQLDIKAHAYDIAATEDGEINTVYPKVSDVNLQTGIFYGSAFTDINTDTIYPLKSNALSSGLLFSGLGAYVIDTMEIQHG